MSQHTILKNIAGCILILMIVACNNGSLIDQNKPVTQKKDINFIVEKLVSIVQNTREYSVRRDIADQIYQIVVTENFQINAKGINAIESLLGDDDDEVVWTAAETLQYLGPRAKSTLPALRHAYDKKMQESACLGLCGFSTGWDVRDVIQIAIKEINQ